MENRRFVLLCILAVILFLMYRAWQEDYGPKPQTAQQAVPEAATATQSPDAINDDLQALPQGAAPELDNAPEQVNGQQATASVRAEKIVSVRTDKLRVDIDSQGGSIQRVELLGIPVSKDQPEQNLQLLQNRPPFFFVAQSGLLAQGSSAPDHRSPYQTTAERYSLNEAQPKRDVRLTWQDGQRQVTKVYAFDYDSYEIELRHEVKNGAAEPWQLSPYVRFWRTPKTEGSEPPFIQSFFGVGWYEQKEGGENYRFTKLAADDLSDEPLKAQQTGGWLAMLQHYFMAVAIPPAAGTTTYFAKPKNLPGEIGAFEGGYVGQQVVVPAGGEHVFTERLYIGPKLQGRLDEIAPGLQLSIDYGILTVLSEPLFWVLDKLHGLTGNWGWAIILLTLAIKAAFYKLSEHQYRAMARMKKFTPRIQSLKERYADDREGMQKAMMDLYKKEGFNPLGGCWPMLVQIPVFIALYWVLLESVELRQADFALWLTDLSSPDPYYVLPVLFGISMWAQQKLSGTAMTMDPMQQRMMTIMPIALTGFFAFFPAGLVLYWLVSNLIGIAQQWFITRRLEAEEEAKKAKAK
ncbi:MAG: membrane protein insertase YidC [Nevskiales bacterium]